METTRILMKERRNWQGLRYVDFKEKHTGIRVGEVDRVEGRYKIFCGTSGWLLEIGTRTNKQSAIKFLQDNIRAGYQGEVEFKWQV